MAILKTFLKTTILIGVAIMLFSYISGYFKSSLDDYQGTAPKMDIKQYFNGPIKGWGIVQNWRGQVVNRFDVDITGIWDNDTGTLAEKFTYYDGKEQNRIWTIRKNPDGTYSGTADDILGQAAGATNGTAARWNYVMDLPVDNTTYRIRFDDWMWQMNDGVLVNRSYLRKFGLTVAELTIFMQKQTP